MLIEQFLNFDILIWGHHYIIQITIGHLKVAKIANIPFSGNLRADCDICDSCKLAFLHKTKLLRMIFTPLEGPALFFLELQDCSSLRIDLQNIKNSCDINQSQASAVTINTNYHRQWFPKQFRLLSYMWQRVPPEYSTFPANDKQLLRYCNCTDDIF